ncbi:MAG: hypothetical protein H6753_01510 [Candidatus Omnitrophica bacterium]|nr:hypothetical protein [Candidatus Omnitrophota bacterium]
MNTIQLIFKKDVLRLRWLLVCWVGIIALRCVISSSFFLDNIETQTRMLQSSQWIFSLMVFMLFVLIPLLVHDDSLIGSTAFWMGKPLSRKALLISKTIFILSFFIVLPTTAELLTLAENGITAHYLWLAMPQILSTWGGIALPVFLLASMTKKFSHFAIALFGIGVFCIAASLVEKNAFNFIMSHGEQTPDNYFFFIESINITICIVNAIIVGLSALTLITYQYLTGDTRKTTSLTIMFSIVLIIVNYFWCWDFMKTFSTHDKLLSSPPKTQIQLLLQTTNQQSQPEIVKFANASNPFTVEVNYYLDLAPDQFVVNIFHEHYQIDSTAGLIPYDWRKESNENNDYVNKEPYLISLINLFKGYHVIPSIEQSSKRKPSYQYTIDGEESFEYPLAHRQLGARMFWQIYRYQITSTVPFRENAHDKFFSQQFIVKNIEKSTDEITAIILEKQAVLKYDLLATRDINNIDDYDSSIQWNNAIYLLRNNQTQEIVFPSFDSDQRNKSVGGPFRILEGRVRYIHFFGNDNAPLNDDWLKDAELIRVDAIAEGRHLYTHGFYAETTELPEE